MKTVIRITAFCLSLICAAALVCACAQQGEDTPSSSQDLQMYGTEPDLAKLIQEIKTRTGIKDLVEVPSAKLLELYGIDAQLTEKSACAKAPGEPFEQEVIIIKAADDTAYQNILSLLEIKLGIMQENAKNYQPNDRQTVEGFKIMKNGRYLALFIMHQHKIAEDLFIKAF